MSSNRWSKSKGLFPRAMAMAAVVLTAAAIYWHHRDGVVKRTPPPQPIAVSVAAAVRQDVPVYVSGLGTVQALNTVPIHSQIQTGLGKPALQWLCLKSRRCRKRKALASSAVARVSIGKAKSLNARIRSQERIGAGVTSAMEALSTN